MLILLALVGGLLLGGGTAGALLRYPYPEPVNAPFFFACTAGLQMAILLIGLLAWFGRSRLVSVFSDFGPVRSPLGMLLVVIGSMLRRLPGERRD